MHAQLEALRRLVALLDPPLHAHLEARDCLSFFFCYRQVGGPASGLDWPGLLGCWAAMHAPVSACWAGRLGRRRFCLNVLAPPPPAAPNCLPP